MNRLTKNLILVGALGFLIYSLFVSFPYYIICAIIGFALIFTIILFGNER